jgi:uncharacterized protein with ParB-like and HNH nuclease domain
MEQQSPPDILRTVGSLLSEKFYIPKYQRGYRWTERQVIDLLDDVNDFKPITRENQQTSWYCLQPLVVFKNSGKWNLVDGQQRLTTIYLILYYLREGLSERRKQEIKLYSLEYETRKNKTDWLVVLDSSEEADSNIDFWHIHAAYQIIKQWFRENSVDEDKFRGKLSEDCKFIWYDIAQTGNAAVSEADVFIRLNIGKIPLTNAELIKALFLNRSNFILASKDGVRLRQLEIATQWDAMEEELANDGFWYFINGKENNTYPRINYLFEVISGKKESENDAYAVFQHFQEKFNGKMSADKPVIDREWEDIYTNYQILREWFKDQFYYHSIGYLLICNESLKSLLDEYSAKTKTEFKKSLTDKIQKKIDWNGDDEIEYSDPRCRRILLLHNVITMQRLGDNNSRFPFDRYHTEKWDIEHIQAIADPEKIPARSEDRKKYLDDVRMFTTDKNCVSEIFGMMQDKIKDNIAFGSLYDKVIKYFAEFDIKSVEINTLSNLALLDSGTNRGYSNAVFPVKRKTILEKDAHGQFIPICTKYAFLKYYTREDSNDLNRWYQRDREKYLSDIKDKLIKYFTKGGNQ